MLSRHGAVLLALVAGTSCSRPRETPAPAARALPGEPAREGAGANTASPPPPPALARDSARGRITLTGTYEVPTIWLSMADGKRIRFDGVGLTRNVVQQLMGLEIVLFGTIVDGGPRNGPLLRAQSYVVRAADGVPAHDGILRRESSGDILEMPDGARIPIPHLPEVLSTANGMRVWLAGAIDAPTRAGVIDPNRVFRLRR